MYTAKPKSKRTLYVVIFAELLVGVGLLVYLQLKKPTPSPLPPNVVATTPHTAEVPESTDIGLPVKLKISKIKVDAAIDQIGLTASGELDVPKSPASTGWYKEGPRPGDAGSAVIDGHFSYQNHTPAVFDNLHTLQKGDTVSVEDEKGASVTFVVQELRTYQPNENTSDIFASNDGKAHLNLITCQGIWNNTRQSSSARLVVFMDKVEK